MSGEDTVSCKKVNNIFSSSRVIIFILGGATFSEVRSGYEVSKDKSSAWEIIVGGDTQILTPEGFLQNVGNLELVQY